MHRNRKLLLIVLLALCSAHCATRAVLKKAGDTPTQINSIDSVEIARSRDELAVIVYAPELRSADKQNYVPAKNAASITHAGRWFQPYENMKRASVSHEEIQRQGGFYLGANEFYLSPEAPRMLRVNDPTIGIVEQKVFYVELEDSFAVGIETRGVFNCYRLHKQKASGTELINYVPSYESQCPAKVVRIIPLTRKYLPDEIMLSIVNQYSEIARLFRLDTKKFGYFSDRYVEIYEIDKIQSNYLWYTLYPFALVWDIATFAFQAAWEIILIRAFAKSYS